VVEGENVLRRVKSEGGNCPGGNVRSDYVRGKLSGSKTAIAVVVKATMVLELVARWQHHATGRGARVAEPGRQHVFTCILTNFV